MSFLTQVDPEIAKMIGEESSRQQNKLELIASENQYGAHNYHPLPSLIIIYGD